MNPEKNRKNEWTSSELSNSFSISLLERVKIN